MAWAAGIPVKQLAPLQQSASDTSSGCLLINLSHKRKIRGDLFKAYAERKIKRLFWQ